jgi:hypothetical protein
MNDDIEVISIIVDRFQFEEIKKAASLIKKRNGQQGVSVKDYLMLLHYDWVVRREEIPAQATGMEPIQLGVRL